MAKYRGLIIALVVVLAIAGIGFLLFTAFPQLIPQHTIPVH